MTVTILLFVGVAVAAVGFYFTFVLRSEIRIAYEQTLGNELDRIAGEIETVDSLAMKLDEIRDIARLTGMRLTVVADDSLLLDTDGIDVIRDDALFEREEMRFDSDARIQYTVREEGGNRMYYVASRLETDNLIVRIGQKEPPLIALIRRMQVTLGMAMIMAVILAVFGSWTAANQVTRPLVEIRNSARSISAGDLQEEIIVESRAAEFQDLARSLNHMSTAFKEKIEELERLALLQNEFIGNVSHEVRNPIFSVGGYLEALSSSSLSASQRRFYAEKGLSNLERLNNLFNDLIEIARLEYREDLINPSIFDLKELAEDIYDFEASKAEEKGLELVVENARVHVCADRSRIRQVLINLIENAIAYSDSGTVRCRFRRRLDKVRIEVVDTGRGIPEEHLERIFERFYRVDPDRSRKSGGTGLGLSIVKQILHAHGETINVESIVGRGTRFWFELPFADDPGPVGTA
jgi:signal transduction histidine kinase